MQLSEVEECYLRALRDAIQLPGVFVEEGALIVYTRGSEPPAYTLYIASLHAGLKTRIASAVEASVHLLPYRDVSSTIVFTLNPRDSRALNTAITASLLGAKTTLVTPQPHEAFEERARAHGVEIVKITSKHPLLAMSIAALRWIPKLMGFREGRVREEISSLQTALTWVYERYKEIIERGSVYDLVAYTPATRPGAYYYCRAVECTEPIPMDALSELPQGARVLALETTAEEHAYKDVLVNARMRGVNVDIVSLNTDPVTATLYSILVALALTRKAL